MCVESLDEGGPPETARDDRLVAKSQGESACILVNAPLVGVALTRSLAHPVSERWEKPLLAQGAMGICADLFCLWLSAPFLVRESV